MREISFVKKLKFNFNGSISKKALVIGDADNDQLNELVCANLQGDLGVFKGDSPDRYAYASDLGMVTACIIGDIINEGMNYVTAINTRGGLFIFKVPCDFDKDASPSSSSSTGLRLKPTYEQIMPANCKDLLLADVDGDGHEELIVGLTDRVLRTYRWVRIGPNRGKFVGLHKWEFADQIGAVSLNPSRHMNCQDIIVAQPGGTYAKLECVDKKYRLESEPTPDVSTADQNPETQIDSDIVKGNNIRTEYISKLTPEYHQLALTQMRNHHVSTDILGGIKDSASSNQHSSIVIATLDGTLMLVNKDQILWSLQVDHQLFASAKLETEVSIVSPSDCYPILSQSESTCTLVLNPEGESAIKDVTQDSSVIQQENHSKREYSQYIIVCAWNGKTYIIDEKRNYLRFKFDQAVSAFTAGNYHFRGQTHSSIVYATFNNQIILFHDIIVDEIRPIYLLNEIENNPDCSDLRTNLKCLSEKLTSLPSSKIEHEHDEGRTNQADSAWKTMRDLLVDLLYSITDDELRQ